MKIAVWHNLPSGGGKRALYYHVRGLVERGHQVHSWCPTTADQTYLPLSELIPERIMPLTFRRAAPTNRLAGLRALYTGKIAPIKALDDHCQQAAEEINRGGFDVLFANTSMELHAGPIGRHARIPKLLYLQEPNRTLYEARPRLPWIAPSENGSAWWSPRTLKRRIPEWINLEGLRVMAREELVNAQAYDSILVNSFFSRENVMRSYGLDAKVCYLGVDTKLFRPLAKDRERFVVSVGSFLAAKGIALAIQAIALLGDPELPFVWIANSVDAAYLEEMKALAASLKVNLQVRERVSDTELVDTLNRAGLLLYTARLEPFGFAPLEANACATPVVAIAEGGVRETVKDNLNGFLVGGEPGCIAEAIAKLLNDSVLSRSLGAQAVGYVREEWGLERSIDRLEGYLFDLAPGSRRGSGAISASLLDQIPATYRTGPATISSQLGSDPGAFGH